MTRRPERRPTPSQRFKKHMARVIYNERSNILNHNDFAKREIKAMFKHFDKKWHDVIADDYPAYLEGNWSDNLEMWNNATANRKTKEAKQWWFFEVETIESYLEHFHKMP